VDPEEQALGALRGALVLLARIDAPVSYAQAAEALGLAPPGRIRRLGALLERLMEEDARAGRPFLAAFVVSPRRGWTPAPGFFETAARLGRWDGPAEGPDAAAFAEAERARAHAAETGRR
jgi:hypothetical protein